MAEFKIQSADGTELTYKNENSKSTFWHSHIMTDAVLQLIEGADTSKWYEGDDELDPEQFWGKILTAIAHSFDNELPEPFYGEDDDFDVVKLLHDLVDDLHERGDL